MIAPVVAQLALSPTQEAPTAAPHPRALGRRALPASIVTAPAVEGVYLLAFLLAGAHVAYGASASTPHAGALHYCGYAACIRERVREHATGRGAHLTLAAFLAGYEMCLVAYWPHAGRAVERRIKGAHRLGRYCPICRYALDTAPIPAPILDAGPGVCSTAAERAPLVIARRSLW